MTATSPFGAKQLTIDGTKCRKDGLCARVCPMRILRQEDERSVPTVERPELCVLCGQCLAVCPNGSIAHSVLDAARLVRIGERRANDVDAATALLRQRRSVRAYKPDPVPRALLEELVQVAAFTPTGAHGGEGWVRNVVVVTGPENMRRVRELTAEYMRQLLRMMDGWMVRLVARWNEHARAGLSMTPDMRMRLAELERGRDMITYEAPAAVFVHAPRVSPTPEIDCDAALYAIMLAAHAAGLGTCWNGWFQKAAQGFKLPSFTAFKELLRVPAHHEVFAAATLGYPAIRLHSVPERRAQVRWIGPG